MKATPSGGLPKDRGTYKCGCKQTEKSQNVGKCSYVPYFKLSNLLFTKSQCLRNCIYRIVITRIHFTRQLHLGIAGTDYGILATERERKMADASSPNPSSEPEKLAPESSDSSAAELQKTISDAFDIFDHESNKTVDVRCQTSCKHCKIFQNIWPYLLVEISLLTVHFCTFKGGWNNCKIPEVLSY